jgi:hypothetical protein
MGAVSSVLPILGLNRENVRGRELYQYLQDLIGGKSSAKDSKRSFRKAGRDINSGRSLEYNQEHCFEIQCAL